MHLASGILALEGAVAELMTRCRANRIPTLIGEELEISIAEIAHKRAIFIARLAIFRVAGVIYTFVSLQPEAAFASLTNVTVGFATATVLNLADIKLTLFRGFIKEVACFTLVAPIYTSFFTVAAVDDFASTVLTFSRLVIPREST